MSLQSIRTCFLILVVGSIQMLLFSCNSNNASKNQVDKALDIPLLKVSKNGHYFQTAKGNPFFWLADTGWLTFKKLDREAIETYFQDRKNKGFNIIQIMTMHSEEMVNIYGDSAVINKDLSKPLLTQGSNFEDPAAYDFWDHVDYALDVAEENQLYLALVPIWGTSVKRGKVNLKQAKEYAAFLGDRFKNRKNIIWLNGGDTPGDQNQDIWNAIGNILHAINPDWLITFHPFGRTDSSDNFHHQQWLDFNMFQSGHRRYDQETSGRMYAQDNYKFVQVDFELLPTKPTLDGEPSYEGIPQGLHDTTQPLWNDNDVRRYAYWSVFAGGAGFTYGHNAVMQMFSLGDKPAYGNKKPWIEALNDPGAIQIHFIKDIILKFEYFNRIPDQSLVANQGKKYDYLAATRGDNFALIYTYNGREMLINMGKIDGNEVTASWFNPRTGNIKTIGTYNNHGTTQFKPPGTIQDGNDWVLILTSK